MRGFPDLVDVGVSGGRIETVRPGIPEGAPEIDAGGCLVSPGFVNLHLHADKSLLGEVMRPNVSGTLPEAIEITNEFPSTSCARRGSTASRSGAASRGSRSCWYYPFGKPDQLEVALLMAHTAQLTLPHELEQVWDMVTDNAARAARLDAYGIAPGRRADLVVIDAPSVHEALRTQPPRRHVIKDGHEVARATLLRELRRPG